MLAIIGGLAQASSDKPQPIVDSDGTVHLPDVAVPPSGLASDKANENFRALVHAFRSPCLRNSDPNDININTFRKRIDDCVMRPGVERLRSVFAVEINPIQLGGVRVDSIVPKADVSDRNRNRVLINLHGGGFKVGAGLGGQMESIPIAALGAIRVVSVDYREGPENKFPAASEDVATIYSALLNTYPANNIGIYGCSAGGILTAESVAWLQAHHLPRPGAIGIFGAGALVSMKGDSQYIGTILTGAIPDPQDDIKASSPYFNVPGLNLKDPLVSPVFDPQVLAMFPPTLSISGTRDGNLSSAIYTHAQLVQQGVDADLQVWEGATHCSFAQPIADPDVPETRQAWAVIVRFFDKHLGK